MRTNIERSDRQFDRLRKVRNAIQSTLLVILIAPMANAATYYSRATGNWTAPSTWSLTGHGGAAATTYPGQLGPGDVVRISGHTVTVAVTAPYSIGAIIMDQLGPAALTKLNLNSAGVVLTCTSFTMGDNNIDQHVELEVSNTARLQVNGPFQVTRSTANDRNKRVRVYVLGNGRIVTTGNFTYNYFRSSGESEMEVQLDGSGRIDIGGNMNCTIGESTHGNDRFNLQMNGSSLLNVTGTTSFLIQNTTDGDDLSIDLNGGVFTSTGAMTIAAATSATSSSDLDVQIDGAVLNANGGLTRTLASTGLSHILLNANSTLVPAALSVGGSLTLDHALPAGMDLVQLNANCTLQVAMDVISTFMEAGSDDQTFELKGGSLIVNGNFMQTVGGSSSAHKYLIKLDNDAQWKVVGNMTILMLTGSSLKIELNTSNGTTAKLIVNGDFLLDKRAAAGQVQIRQKKSSLLQVDRDMKLFFEAGNDDHVYQLENDLNRLVVGGALRVELRAGTGTSDKLDWNGLGGTITVTGNVDLLHAGGDDVHIHCKNNEVFTIGGHLNIQHTGGDDMVFTIDNTAQLIVGSKVTLNDATTGSSLTSFIMKSNSIARFHGDLSMTATAGLELLLSLQNNSRLYLKGSLLRQASPQKFGSIHMDNTAYIELNGNTGSQVITDDAGNGGDAVVYTNMIVNNSFTTIPQVSTIGKTSIHKTLTLTNGVIGTTPSTLLVISKGATCNQGSAISHVDGPMKKVGKDPFVFPVGNNGRWMRLGMENINNANDDTEFICRYFVLPSPNNTPPFYGTGIDHVSYIEHWHLDRYLDDNNDASCDVRLFWQDAVVSDINTSALSDLRVAQFRGTTNRWESQGGSATGGFSGNVVSTIPLTTFGYVTFASASGLNPLPIELVDFRAIPVDLTVHLEWITASEVNNDHFEVERSVDGSLFEVIAIIPGAGNSMEALQYSIIDVNPVLGTNFYRLRQVDQNGSSTTSNTVAVEFKPSDGPAINVYPNPCTDALNVQLGALDISNLLMEVLDQTGRVLRRERMNVQGQLNVRLPMPDLATGTYSLILRSEEKILGMTRFMKVE